MSFARATQGTNKDKDKLKNMAINTIDIPTGERQEQVNSVTNVLSGLERLVAHHDRMLESIFKNGGKFSFASYGDDGRVALLMPLGVGSEERKGNTVAVVDSDILDQTLKDRRGHAMGYSWKGQIKGPNTTLSRFIQQDRRLLQNRVNVPVETEPVRFRGDIDLMSDLQYRGKKVGNIQFGVGFEEGQEGDKIDRLRGGRWFIQAYKGAFTKEGAIGELVDQSQPDHEKQPTADQIAKREGKI